MVLKNRLGIEDPTELAYLLAMERSPIKNIEGYSLYTTKDLKG